MKTAAKKRNSLALGVIASMIAWVATCLLSSAATASSVSPNRLNTTASSIEATTLTAPSKTVLVGPKSRAEVSGPFIANLTERSSESPVNSSRIYDSLDEVALECTVAPVSGPSRYAQLRSQVEALKDVGVSSRAGRRAFFEGEQAAFARANGQFGSIDGWVQRSGDKVSSIVFSMRGRDAAGNLLKIGDAPISGGTGLRLLGEHRSLNEGLARAFGARQLELGGTAVVNQELLGLLNRLKFEQRSVFSKFFGEDVPYWGRDFGVR
jgi:hypothetical protein